jgi:hypothetical protein
MPAAYRPAWSVWELKSIELNGRHSQPKDESLLPVGPDYIIQPKDFPREGTQLGAQELFAKTGQFSGLETYSE